MNKDIDAEDTYVSLDEEGNPKVKDLLVPKEDEPVKIRDSSWLWASFGATICFGIAAYFIGEVSEHGLISKWLMSFGFFILCFIYMMVVCGYQRYTKGYFFKLTKSDLWKVDESDGRGTGSFDWSRFWGLLGAALSNFFGTLFVALCFQYSLLSGVNQGVVSTLFVLSSIFCAILAYFLMNEVMSLTESFGMLLVILCGVIIAFSNEVGEVLQIDYKDQVSPMVPILMATLSSVAFGARSIFIKYHATNGYNVYNLAVQHLAFDGVVGTICLVIFIVQYGSPPGSILLKGTLSGMIAGTGTILINYSISEGIAGPAAAIPNLGAVI